jgi:hypothetical protein
MWGNQQDFSFLAMLMKRNQPLSADKKLIPGRGLNADSENPDFVPQKMIKTSSINRYYTSESNASGPNIKYYRKNKDNLFVHPYIIVKQGQHNREIASSIIDYKAYCTTGAFVINGENLPLSLKKTLVAYFNSDIAKYILFLTSSSWGIEREQIFLNELMEIPFVFSEQTNYNITQCFDNIVNQLKNTLPNQQIISDNEKIIQTELCKILNISKKEQILIEDTLRFSLDLFEQGEKSIGFKRILPEENKSYAEMIRRELTDFFHEENIKINVTIYDIQKFNPLNLIMLQFDDVEKPLEIKKADDINPVLKILNNYSLQEKGKNIYVQKQFRYYEKDKIYMIKPNQKRFWTRSQAMDDAQSLIIEIANMGR